MFEEGAAGAQGAGGVGGQPGEAARPATELAEKDLEKAQREEEIKREEQSRRDAELDAAAEAERQSGRGLRTPDGTAGGQPAGKRMRQDIEVHGGDKAPLLTYGRYHVYSHAQHA